MTLKLFLKLYFRGGQTLRSIVTKTEFSFGSKNCHGSHAIADGLSGGELISLVFKILD